MRTGVHTHCFIGLLQDKWPQMNLGSTLCCLCHEWLGLSPVCQMHYLTLLVLQPILRHHPRIESGSYQAQTGALRGETLTKCFSVQTIKWNILLGLSFPTKDCYASQSLVSLLKAGKVSRGLRFCGPLASSAVLWHRSHSDVCFWS